MHDTSTGYVSCSLFVGNPVDVTAHIDYMLIAVHGQQRWPSESRFTNFRRNIMPSPDHQRRRFIAKTVTVGCVLAVPGILSGCGGEEAKRLRETDGDDSDTTSSNGGGGQQADTGSRSQKAQTDSQNQQTESSGQRSGNGSQADAQGGKISQEQANYQKQPKGQEKCSNCQQFVAESNTCKLVQGQISPNGWCKLWVAKA